MLADLLPTVRAIDQARGMKGKVNACAGRPELGNSPARDVIRDKGWTSPFFYTELFNVAKARTGIPIDCEGLNKLGVVIIIADEAAEQPGCEMGCDECLGLALDHVGLVGDKQCHPLVVGELQNMYNFMLKENNYRRNWVDLPQPGRARPTIPAGIEPDTYRYDQYKNIVGHSFGVLPFFAKVAVDNGETEAYQLEENHQRLEGLELASRILADVITLGKDQRKNKNKDANKAVSLNIVSEFQQTHPGCSLQEARQILCLEAKDIIAANRERLENNPNSPVFLRFAQEFAEVLLDISPSPETTPKCTLLLKLLGGAITHLIFPLQKENAV